MKKKCHLFKIESADLVDVFVADQFICVVTVLSFYMPETRPSGCDIFPICGLMVLNIVCENKQVVKTI